MHCKRIQRHYTVLIDVIKDKQDLHKKCNEIFKISREAQRLISANGFLCKGEVDRIKKLCNKYIMFICM